MEIRVLGLVLLLMWSAALRAEAQTWEDFRRKHIDQNMNGNRCNREINVKGINPAGTCKRMNSFIRATDDQVINVCQGAGKPVGGNLYESKRPFTVVTCDRTQTKPCRYKGRQRPKYITVACRDRFPVHYERERPA